MEAYCAYPHKGNGISCAVHNTTANAFGPPTCGYEDLHTYNADMQVKLIESGHDLEPTPDHDKFVALSSVDGLYRDHREFLITEETWAAGVREDCGKKTPTGKMVSLLVDWNDGTRSLKSKPASQPNQTVQKC